jgi:hypothetical protein
MEAAFRVETLEDALACHGKPEIFNIDQGSQFTGEAFTGGLIDNGIAISMDQGRLARQRQIRGGVSQGLRQYVRGPHIDWPLSRFLRPHITEHPTCYVIEK